MTDFIKKIINAVYDCLFPVRCPYCGKVINKNDYACTDCKKLFPEKSIERYAVGGYKCVSPFPYSGIFSKAVKKFKFGNCGGYSKQLSFMVVQSILQTYNISEIDVVTCVPMHKKSLKKRGYNHSQLLAKECAQIMNIPYADLLKKTRENKAQHSIKANKRADNVKGVYEIISKDSVKNKNILLIDDIITTGNTLGECSRILTQHGCKAVNCAVLCSVDSH